MTELDDFNWDEDPLAPAPKTETQAKKAGAAVPAEGGRAPLPPTEKQLAFARRLMSERPGTVGPEGWDKDWRICSGFIDDMKKKPPANGAGKGAGQRTATAGVPPTDKQIGYATKLLSERPGFKEPANWRGDRKACSEFIDAMLKVKPSGGRGGRPAGGSGGGTAGGGVEDAAF